MHAIILFALISKFSFGKLRLRIWPLAFIISFTPIYFSFTSQYYLSAIFSELSISSIYLFTYWLFGIQSSRNAKKFHHLCFFIIAIAALLFYGVWYSHSWDLYYFGFAHPYLLLSIFILMSCCIFLNYWYAFWLLLLGLIAFQCNLLESNNLWNYYIDPLLIIVLLGNYLVSACQWGIRKLKNE